jgi:hypothetical protein
MARKPLVLVDRKATVVPQTVSVEIAVGRDRCGRHRRFVIALFCVVDDRLACRHKHPQAHLWPSELVAIGLLFALKGSSFRSFYRWLERDYGDLLGGLPERTRLVRALRVQQHQTERFRADPTFFTVIDTDGIELIHPGGMVAVRAKWARTASATTVGSSGSSCAG